MSKAHWRIFVRVIAICACFVAFIIWPLSHFYMIGVQHFGQGMQGCGINTGVLRMYYTTRSYPSHWSVVAKKVEIKPDDTDAMHFFGFLLKVDGYGVATMNLVGIPLWFLCIIS